MPAKVVRLEGVGPIKIYKRKGVRTIRLSIVGDGSVRITQPRWLPYKAGIEFATSRRRWIQKNSRPVDEYFQLQNIGKTFVLDFQQSDSAMKPRTRITGKRINVYVPTTMQSDNPAVQTAAQRGIERALKLDAEELLIPRLKMLAEKHGFRYRSVEVKKLKSRWGSCSQHKDITLSSFLVQLPWELIDYVLLHELQHTVVLAHGKDFWDALGQHVQDLKNHRKTIKNFQARIL